MNCTIGGNVMMHKVEIIYSSQPCKNFYHDGSGTNVITIDRDFDNYSHYPDTFSLIFDLFDTDVVKKFVKVWNGYPNDTESLSIHWNNYCDATEEERIIDQQAMNTVLNSINQLQYKHWRIPNEHFLLIDFQNNQLNTLNILHKFFEDVSYDVIQERKTESNYHDNYLDFLFAELEKVNYLVHRMERDVNTTPSSYNVLRNTSVPDEAFILLTEDDYRTFESTSEYETNAILYLDYSTVGKDLEACWITNDIELVKNKEVKQQTHISSAMNYVFSSFTEKKCYFRTRHAEYYKWCHENNVQKYYEYWLPKFNLGRIPLGHSKDIKNINDYNKMIEYYPYIVGVIVK